MADVQLRALKVSAELDSSRYVAGARDIAEASRTVGAAVAGVGTTVSQTDSKISTSVSGFERLKRQFIEGHAASQDFETKLKQLSDGIGKGAFTTNEAARAVEGIVRRYGMMADASGFVARGQTELAEAVDRANAKLREQSTIKPPAFDVAALRASQNGANFSSDLNARLGIGADASSARASASVFEEAAREAERYAQQAAALRAAIDPVGASQARVNAEIAEYTALLNRAEISTTEFAQAQALAQGRHDQFVASMNRSPISANDNNSQFRRQNLGYQVFDVAQMQALGQSPMMTLMQQGPQIAQLYMGQGGLKAAAGDANAALAGTASLARAAFSAIGPLGLAFGAAGVAAGAFYLLTRTQSKTTDEVLKAHAANIKALGEAYGIAEKKAKDYAEADRAISLAKTQTSTKELQSRAGGEIDTLFKQFGTPLNSQNGPTQYNITGIYAPFETAFERLRKNADPAAFVREINEIGRARGIENLSLQVITAAERFTGLKEQIDAANRAMQQTRFPNLTARTDEAAAQAAARIRNADALSDMQRQHAASLSGLGARSPEELAAAARARVMAEPVTPGEDSVTRQYRANAAAALAYAQAQNDLKIAQEQRIRTSEASLKQAEYEVSLIGKSVAERNRLTAAYQAEQQIRQAAAQTNTKADEAEIAAARARAAAIADANAKVAAVHLVQGQGDQIEQLRLEAQLVGASASERARLTAALQAEQQLRQQGIDKLSQEGQAYIANAQAMAQARLEIERQNAAYSSLEQAGGSAIDALTVGTGSLKDRLKSAADTMLQWIQQMTIANPLKNAIFGSNLPTMGDLFSGKTAVPGAQSTATMTVTAGTVMVNGGVTSGLTSGVPTGTALDAVTKTNLAPATSNPANSPALAGLLDDPSLANRTAASTVANTGTQSQVWNYWAAKGLPPHQIAGIMGNMDAESKFNPAAVGDGGNAFGLAQWNDRGPAMKAYVGSDWRSDTQGQLDFMNREFQTTESASWNRLRSSTDVTSATAAVAGYERPQGFSLANPQGSHNWEGRLDAANSNLAKFASTTATTSKSMGTLDDSTAKLSTSLTDNLGKLATPAVTPQVPAVTPTAATGSNPFASLFGGFFKLLGFADGTDYSPGGMAMVGERGREIVNLPRGSQVVPNHKMNMALGKNFEGMGGRTKVDVGVTVDDDGKLKAYVKSISEETSIATTSAGISAYDTELPNRIEAYRQNPYNRGGF